ncbi:unnamed protein product [Trichobilharzia regenti]|nr:unnamed protein product [Trichobilharzia regenti]
MIVRTNISFQIGPLIFRHRTLRINRLSFTSKFDQHVSVIRQSFFSENGESNVWKAVKLQREHLNKNFSFTTAHVNLMHHRSLSIAEKFLNIENNPSKHSGT